MFSLRLFIEKVFSNFVPAMAKKKYKAKEKKTVAKEPEVVYQKNRITFSTLETQGDVQLIYSMNAEPIERLEMMRKLNDYAFKNLPAERLLTGKTRLIFSSYEYIPG